MSTLHTVNKSPFTHSTLVSCMAICQPGDALLLIEDGVYAALPSSPVQKRLKTLADSGVTVAALGPDLDARGLTSRSADWITTMDYDGFVTLSTTLKTVQSWY